MKVFNIDTETESGLRALRNHNKLDSPLFMALEEIFDKELEGDRNWELREMYFSEDAIYTKAGCVRGMIEHVFEIMDEYELKWIHLSDNRLDFSAVIN